MSSFGDWYEQQKSAAADNNNNGGGGLFAGLIGGSASTNDEGGSSSTILPMFTGVAEDGANTLNSLKSSIESSLPQKVMGMNYQQRFKVFGIALMVSVLFFFLGFMVGLPMIAVRPQKFAISFTFGSLIFMFSFMVLKGPKEHLMSMCQTDRLPFTTLYFGSMVSTLYFTFSWGGLSGYVLVIASSAVQIVTLVWYLIAFIPGGSNGLQLLLKSLATMLKPVCIVVNKFCTTIVSGCCKLVFRR